MTETSKTFTYDHGDVLRNVTVGRKDSEVCTTSGDSGGPARTVRSNGHVNAKGILSGGLRLGE